jgi:hypothetical protein
MGLDRFSASYKPPMKEEVKITKEQLAEIARETRTKDKRFATSKRKEELREGCKKWMESFRSYKQPMLAFPLVPWGKSMRYDIPMDQRETVINSLDIFKRESVSLYNGVYKDTHSDKIVKGSELEVIREDDKNWVVSSHYNESGGTLIDLRPLDETTI